MKRFLLLLTGLILFSMVSIMIALGCLFFRPQWFIKQSSLVWVLDRWAPFEYSLESFDFKHQRISFFEREISIEIKNFLIVSDQEYEAHLEYLEIFGRISRASQWQFHSPQSNTIVFDRIAYKVPHHQGDPKVGETKTTSLSLQEKWQLLWKDIYPEFKLVINEVDIQTHDQRFIFPLEIFRSNKSLNVQFFELDLQLTPDSLTLFLIDPEQFKNFFLPQTDIPFPSKTELSLTLGPAARPHLLNIEIESHLMTLIIAAQLPDRIDLQNIEHYIEDLFPSLEIHLHAPELLASIPPFMAHEQKNMLLQLKNEQQLKAKLNAAIKGLQSENGTLSFEMQSLLDVEVNQLELRVVHETKTSFLTDDLVNSPQGIISEVLTGTKVELIIEQLNQRWEQMKNIPFELPAPLNSLEGDLALVLSFQNDSNEKDQILANLNLSLDLEGHGQNLHLKTFTSTALDANDITQLKGPIETIVRLDRVNLRLPQLQASSSAPQLLADSRIVLEDTPIPVSNTSTTAQRPEINLQLKATKESPVSLSTNLLNEQLRFVFDLNIEKGEIKKGIFELLPLQLEIFRRQIAIRQLEVVFQAPRLPQIKGLIEFRLPQYLIELHLEGTSEQIRHHFTSSPPLPQGDIFAVLLFGRPLTDLSESDRTASNQTQQYLSDGLLSLSLLYFLSGGPIESIGFNPETGSISAQVGITDNSSLRVSTSADGQNTASVRRSLGKGWYIDTSVQRSSQPTHGSQQDYGVLLERIMAY